MGSWLILVDPIYTAIILFFIHFIVVLGAAIILAHSCFILKSEDSDPFFYVSEVQSY